MARVIRDSVSSTIRDRLSDPRITGLVGVTEVDISPDSKNVTVFLSVFGVDETAGKLTFKAIQHAVGHIQAVLGKDLPGRVCPHLRFELDTKTKKTMEVLHLIDQASREYNPLDVEEEDEDVDDEDAEDTDTAFEDDDREDAQ